MLRASRSAVVSLVACNVARGRHLVATSDEHERPLKIFLDTAVADRHGVDLAHKEESLRTKERALP